MHGCVLLSFVVKYSRVFQAWCSLSHGWMDGSEFFFSSLEKLALGIYIASSLIGVRRGGGVLDQVLTSI
jgi:hypothetical protein